MPEGGGEPPLDPASLGAGLAEIARGHDVSFPFPTTSPDGARLGGSPPEHCRPRRLASRRPDCGRASRTVAQPPHSRTGRPCLARSAGGAAKALRLQRPAGPGEAVQGTRAIPGPRLFQQKCDRRAARTVNFPARPASCWDRNGNPCGCRSLLPQAPVLSGPPSRRSPAAAATSACPACGDQRPRPAGRGRRRARPAPRSQARAGADPPRLGQHRTRPVQADLQARDGRRPDLEEPEALIHGSIVEPL